MQDKASEMHPEATCQTNTLSCTKRVFTKLSSCLEWVVCSAAELGAGFLLGSKSPHLQRLTASGVPTGCS